MKMNLKLFLIPIIFFLFKSYLCIGLNSEKIDSNIGCNLEDYLLTFDQIEDFRLQENILNLDTLHYEFEPRYGYSLNVIGFIKLDTTTNTTNILVDRIKIYAGRSDGFNNKEIELYFKNKFEEYIYALTEKFGLNVDSLRSNCSFIILQRKYRSCG